MDSWANIIIKMMGPAFLGLTGVAITYGYLNRKWAREDLRKLDFIWQHAEHTKPPPTAEELKYLHTIYMQVTIYAATPSAWILKTPPKVDWEDLPMDHAYIDFLSKS